MLHFRCSLHRVQKGDIPCLQEASQFSMLDVIYIRKYLAKNQKATGHRLCFARSGGCLGLSMAC